MDTKQQVAAVLEIVRAVADTIRDAGSVPNGTIYAALMAKGATLDQHNQIIAMLVRSGLVRQSGDMLHWAA